MILNKPKQAQDKYQVVKICNKTKKHWNRRTWKGITENQECQLHPKNPLAGTNEFQIKTQKERKAIETICDAPLEPQTRQLIKQTNKSSNYSSCHF